MSAIKAGELSLVDETTATSGQMGVRDIWCLNNKANTDHKNVARGASVTKRHGNRTTALPHSTQRPLHHHVFHQMQQLFISNTMFNYHKLMMAGKI
jgi:hypothetical protein